MGVAIFFLLILFLELIYYESLKPKDGPNTLQMSRSTILTTHFNYSFLNSTLKTKTCVMVLLDVA